MNEVIDQLLAIEQDYYAGMGFQTLSKRIVKVSATIASLDEQDPAQQACRTFAPMLWEATSGASVNPSAIKQALAGPDGGRYLQAWVNMGSVVPTFKLAA